MINKIEQISQLDLNSREFEDSVTKFVVNEVSEKELNKLAKILLDNNEILTIRFTAFFILFTFYRRKNLYGEIESLFKDSLSIFENNDQFLIIGHIKLLAKAMTSHSESELKILLDESERLLRNNSLKKHIGVLHFYAHVVCDYLELKNYFYETLNDQNPTHQRYIDTAFEYVQNCINEDPSYPKFYFTKSRLDILNNKFDDAIKDLVYAMEKEIPTRTDYYETIDTYRSYLVIARQLKQSAMLVEQNKTLNDNISDINSNNFKLISMFSTIITLIISNVTVAATNDEPIKLMFMLNGMFFIFFGIILLFVNMITRSKSKVVNIFIYIVSSFLIFAGIFILFLFYFKEVM